MRVDSIVRAVDDEQHTAGLRGGCGVIQIGTTGRIIARGHHMILENHIAVEDVAVLHPAVTMRWITCAGRHADQRREFAAHGIFI